MNIHIINSIRITSSLLITCYSFMPIMVCTVICVLRFDAFFKTAICIAFSTIVYYYTNYVVDKLFGVNNSSYHVNFNDWNQFLSGNVQFICLISLLFISFIFLVVGVARSKKR